MSGFGAGNWFHPRISTSQHEKHSIVKLVEVSSNYPALRWSGKKTDPQNIAFAQEISVDPSQMQTKIRAFIRAGFIKDSNLCPLKWTHMGKMWRTIVISPIKNVYENIENKLEKLILASSLSLYSFTDLGISKYPDPSKEYRPVFELIQASGESGFISLSNIKTLIWDGTRGRNNFSYWIGYLKDSGLISEVSGGFKIADTFPNLINAIRTISLPTNLTTSQWKQILNDPLDSLNPFYNAILSELNSILDFLIDIEADSWSTSTDILNVIIENSSAIEDDEIENKNYTVPDEWGRAKKRRKQTKWADKVKEYYNYHCCVPLCDVQDKDFLEAAHIKPYSVPEEGAGHRANPHNGLCMCPYCHALFDAGYFTVSSQSCIIVSESINLLTSKRLTKAVKESNGSPIRKCDSRGTPEQSFLRYHEDHILKT